MPLLHLPEISWRETWTGSEISRETWHEEISGPCLGGGLGPLGTCSKVGQLEGQALVEDEVVSVGLYLASWRLTEISDEYWTL